MPGDATLLPAVLHLQAFLYPYDMKCAVIFAANAWQDNVKIACI